MDIPYDSYLPKNCSLAAFLANSFCSKVILESLSCEVLEGTLLFVAAAVLLAILLPKLLVCASTLFDIPLGCEVTLPPLPIIPLAATIAAFLTLSGISFDFLNF